MRYFSFLICAYETHTDLFLSGFPIGVIREGRFALHQVLNPDGSRRDITMRDLQNLVSGGCPFATIEELQEHISKVIASAIVPARA